MTWVRACPVNEIDAEDVARFDHVGRTFAIYRTRSDEFYCSDGRCSHQQEHLAGGLLTGHVIECPKHNGRFDIRTGHAVRRPASVKLSTYPARAENGFVWVQLPD